MRDRPQSLLLAVAAAGLLTGCGVGLPRPQPPPLPSAEAAIAHLERIVTAVRSGRLERVCALGGGNCAAELAESDPDAVPARDPVVLGTRVIPNRPAGDDGWHVGGVLIELCGRDGLGKRYSSQMLVFRDERDELRSINTLYWLGMGIIESNDVDSVPRPVGACPGLDDA